MEEMRALGAAQVSTTQELPGGGEAGDGERGWLCSNSEAHPGPKLVQWQTEAL